MLELLLVTSRKRKAATSQLGNATLVYPVYIFLRLARNDHLIVYSPGMTVRHTFKLDNAIVTAGGEEEKT